MPESHCNTSKSSPVGCGKSSCSSQQKSTSPAHAVEILGKLYNNCKTGKGCDVKLRAEGNVYHAHRALLMELSPYFETMFSGSFVESEESVVTFETIEPSVIEVILDFAYAKCISITHQNVQEVLSAAHLLQISELVKKCSDHMIANIEPKRCIGVFSSAKLYMDSGSIKWVHKYLMEYFREVSLGEEFLEVDAETLIEMLKEESLVVDNEDQVFEAVMRWFLFNQKDRTPLLEKVLNHVRLAHVSSNLLKERSETVEALRRLTACQLFLGQRNPQLLEEKVYASFSERRPSWPVEALMLCVTNQAHTGEVCITETGKIVRARSMDFLDYDEMIALRRYSRIVSYGEVITAVLKNRPRIYDRYTCTWKAAFFGSFHPFDAGLLVNEIYAESLRDSDLPCDPAELCKLMGLHKYSDLGYMTYEKLLLAT